MTDGECPDRVQSFLDQQERGQPGPRNGNYLQIILSNPVVDASGVVHVVLHNGLTGTADLMSRSTAGHWTARSLTAAATSGARNSRVHIQSSLALLPDGQLRAALMIEQTDESEWGAAGTGIVFVESRGNGAELKSIQVTPSDEGCAQWLPAQPHCVAAMGERLPPMLYTKGLNAGGFSNNQNAVQTEVFLCKVEPEP